MKQLNSTSLKLGWASNSTAVIPAPNNNRGKHLAGIQDNNLIVNIQKSIDLIMSSGLDYEFRTTVAKPLHHPGDFVEIGRMVKGAKKFYIQNFVKSKHINEHAKFEPFDDKDLKISLNNVAPFVSLASVR